MHYMDASTYDLDDLGDFAIKQGIYVFKSLTQLINGPGGSITGPCTLQVLYNSADPADDDIYAQQILHHSNDTYIRTCYWWQVGSTQYQTEWGAWQIYTPSDWRYIGEFAATETKPYPSGAKELIAEVPWVNTDFTYSYSFHIIASNANMNNEEYYRLGSYDKVVNGTPQAGGASVKIDRRNKTIKVNSVYYNGASQSLSNMKFRIYYR